MTDNDRLNDVPGFGEPINPAPYAGKMLDPEALRKCLASADPIKQGDLFSDRIDLPDGSHADVLKETDNAPEESPEELD